MTRRGLLLALLLLPTFPLLAGVKSTAAAPLRSDVSDISSALIHRGDVASRYSVEHHKVYNSLRTYGTGLPMGKAGNCQEQAIPARDWRQGLAQSLVDRSGYGFQECVERLKSDAAAKHWYQDAVTKVGKQKLLKRVSVPRIGDSTFALTLSVSTETLSLVAFLHGDTIVAVAGIAKTKSGIPVSTLVSIAQKVNGRLK